MNSTSSDINNEVSELFGLYKAEWLNEKLYELFTAPSYFNELKTQKPCVLIGGRGTGKTTVLKGLSYKGQYALCKNNKNSIKEWKSYGLYTRVNTNRVTAFKGPELNKAQWIRCFAHYFNLLLCESIIEFIDWYQNKTDKKLDLSSSHIETLSISLHLDKCEILSEFSSKLKKSRVKFEAAINNVGDGVPKGLSIQCAPVDELTNALMELEEFSGKQLFFIIDEYENFEDYQQQVVNTYIKHTQDNYTFKIGVRELGWRQRSTLNSSEQLRHPADYVRINIHDALTQERFDEFAANVCNGRLETIAHNRFDNPQKVEFLFPGLTTSGETELLIDDKQYFIKTRNKFLELTQDKEFINNLNSSELYYLDKEAQISEVNDADYLKEVLSNKRKWQEQYNNHIHSTLFGIRKGKRGIRKYYSGWKVLTRLSGQNIRFLLELVHNSLTRHFEDNESLNISISPHIQTIAAQEVGRKNLSELEGISVDGARLTKLLLGLGRIFEVMAENPDGHAPEVNQFYINWNTQDNTNTQETITVENLLKSAVMHQALIRLGGSKVLDDSDIRDYDYMMHPIFSALFVISHRKKRKFIIKHSQLLNLLDKPKKTIQEILKNSNRDVTESLPDQLSLFKEYYGNSL